MTQPVQLLRELEQRHGDIFTIHLLRERPWVLVSDPGLVKHVLTASGDVLHAGKPKRILEPVVGRESVLLNDGDRHLRERRLLLPAFHAERVKQWTETMRAIAVAEVDRWPLDEPHAAAPRLSAIALELILRTVFGLDDDRRSAPAREALRRLVEYLAHEPRTVLVALGAGARFRSARFAEFRRIAAGADRAIRETIARRRAEPTGGTDVLSVLLEARHEDGAPVADEELRDQLMSLLLAGHETTAASLAWALERLARSPTALERLAAEAERGGGEFTDATIQETLRLRSPFMHLAREVRRPFPLRDYVLPEGVVVAIAIPLVHRRSDIYPDPDAFRPERFLGSPPGTYTWIPFGGGIRRCIGAGFAMAEMRAVLSVLFERATVRCLDKESEPAARRMLVMAPGRDAQVVLEPRRRSRAGQAE
jgi:cytochrome P450